MSLLLTSIILNSCIMEAYELPDSYKIRNGALIYDFTTSNVVSPALEMLDMAIKYEEITKTNSESEYRLLKNLYFPKTEIRNHEQGEKKIVIFSTLTTKLRMEINGKNINTPGSVLTFTGNSFTLTVQKDTEEKRYNLYVNESLVSNLGMSILSSMKLSVAVEKNIEMDENPFLYHLTGGGNYTYLSRSFHNRRQTHVAFNYTKQTTSKRFDYYDLSLRGFNFQNGEVELTATGKHLGNSNGKLVYIIQNKKIEKSNLIKVRYQGASDIFDLLIFR